MSIDSRRAARTVALLAASLGAAVAAMLLRPYPDAVATWWPSAGLSIAALVLAPTRQWPVIGLGVATVTALASSIGGRPLDIGVGLGLSNATEALVAAAVLHRLHRGTPVLRSPADYVRMLLTAAAAAATFGVCVVVTTTVLGTPVWPTVRTVVPSHLAAVLVILPVVLLAEDWRATMRRRRRELLLQATLLGVVLLLLVLTAGGIAALFLPVPLLVWAALRLRPLVAAAEVVLTAVVITWATALGSGPIADVAARSGVDGLATGTDVQVLLVCLALLTVPVSLASSQRDDLVRHLEAERQLSATTLATTASIIVLTDHRGVVHQVNDSLARLTGFAPEDMVGRPFWEAPLIPAERVDLVREMYAAPDGSSVVQSREADVMHRDGDRLRVLWHNNVVRDDDGRVLHVVCTATDVTSERTSHLLIEHLFSAPMAAPMLSIDADLVVTMVNRAGADLLGVDAATLVGQSATALLLPDQRDRFVAELESAALRAAHGVTTAPLVRDWTWHRPDDGRVLTLSTTVSAVQDAVGKQAGYLLVARDATASRASHDALVRALDRERHAVERLRRLDAVKNEFVSTVSHELRTPTTSIVGYTEMLRDDEAGLDEAQREMLDVVARNGRRLIDIANDLLTLAGLEDGDRSSWRPRPVDLGEVVADSRVTVGPLLGDRVLDVVVELPQEPVVVVGDHAHLDRVVVNLLSNAVKFTPDHGRVGVVLRRAETDAVLEVSDTGIGIPDDEQADLFTKFFRSSTAQAQAIPGTGLGLSIVHGIVEAHGGTIEVRSAHHEGTTFTVRLPLEQPAGGGPAPATPATPVDDELDLGLPVHRVGPEGTRQALSAG